MNKTEKARAGMLAGLDAGKAQAATDRRLAADADRARETAHMKLADILGRAGAMDTRKPSDADVEAVAESIDALGLLEPIVTDRAGVLLAGKTRLLALRRLAMKDPDRWAFAPVRKMPFFAEEDPARALACEVAENEKRRDYTTAEIKALADRLRKAGFKDTKGRPRKGTKALAPALGAVVGKSRRQLLRILAPEKTAPEAQAINAPYVAFTEAAARLARALRAFNSAAAMTDARKLAPDERRALRDAAALAETLTKMKGKPCRTAA